MPPIGQDKNPWIIVHEMRVDGCQGVGLLDEDMSSEDDYILDGSSRPEYVIRNETSPGNGPLSSNNNKNAHIHDFRRPEARNPYVVYSYTTPSSGLGGTPRSSGPFGEESMYRSPSTLLSGAAGPNKSSINLKDKNLGILKRQINGREPVPETEDGLQRRQCPRNALQTERSAKIGPATKRLEGDASAHTLRAQNAAYSGPNTQNALDSSSESRAEHRQIGDQNKPRIRKSRDDKDDVSEDEKEN
ncbi:hypothetical protein ONS95_014166 [Cadophora gregata]|uniref:uncharacterized protein n=1 Tax=Cadophora gregata TaxID=51156 RepID=UPI0026DD1C34|nr:uncharacterized protein ONS95_014166 [Cadophora gregata]KAK0113925.1 hypothetical protein ONS96_014774 [Cadophora gregata f. sp. sojae]KAK0114681.1 hypothetical protein ONS95_014166 [Cadophora gregata]